MKTVVIGDLNVDMEIRLPDGERVSAHSNPDPRLRGGGSAANTAAALGRLGADCHFVGTVGGDAFGAFARASLEESGVDVSSVDTTTVAPTVTVITVVRPDGDRLIYVWPPHGGAHQEVGTEAAVAAVDQADWLHVSGICLRVAPSRGTLLAVMARARSQGVPVSLDLNLRLENWGWDGGFREIVEEAVSLSDVIMGSAADEVMPLAGSEDPLDAARKLAGDDRTVVARLGVGGALASSGDVAVSVPSFAVDLADTVGAGDAHNAGFILASLRGADVEEALRWGNAVGALTVSRPGARSTPTLSEVENLLSGGGS